MKKMKVDKLKVCIFDTRAEMGQAAADEASQEIRDVLAKKGNCNIIFAAAPSQNELLAALVKSDVDWSRVNAFHMDEYIGLAAGAKQLFANFLDEAIFGQLPFGQVFRINGSAEDAAAEVARYARLLDEYPVDLCCLGIGENGHIAFNDPPHARFDEPEPVLLVELDEKSRVQQVNDGCFERLDQVPTHALTLTIPALTRAEKMVCVAPGGTKADAVKRSLSGEVAEDCPATILRRHDGASLYLDMASSSKLDMSDMAD